MNNIDYERLRRDLIDHVGPGATIMDALWAEVLRIENANDSQLEEIAEYYGFDLSDYEEYTYRR